MNVYILDSSALIRYIDNEAGAERVEHILKACVAGTVQVQISALQWGEVAGNIRTRFGPTDQLRLLGTILPSEAKIYRRDRPASCQGSGIGGGSRDCIC